MKITGVIVAGIAGTTAFTLFSYILSEGMGKNFKEPELIGKMFGHGIPELGKEQAQFSGWMTHYLVGIAFAAAYEQLIQHTGIKPTVQNGIVAGALSGFPAALTWDTALKVHPAPPRKRSMVYYAQLLAGHAIFGAASFWVLGRLGKRQSSIVNRQ